MIPTSAQATADLCLDWSRLIQQKHVFEQASDVSISNDRAKEEVPKQAGRNGLEGRGCEEDTSQTALACWAPGFQDLTQCLMSFPLQVPDVGGGMKAWHVCGQRAKRASEHPMPSHPWVRLAPDLRLLLSLGGPTTTSSIYFFHFIHPAIYEEVVQSNGEEPGCLCLNSRLSFISCLTLGTLCQLRALVSSSIKWV